MAARSGTTTVFGNVSVTLYGPALAELLKGPSGPVVRNMIELGERVKQEAIRIAPRKTGNLAAHIVKRIERRGDDPVVLVGVENVKYAIYVHEGAAPHEIRGNPLLVFYWEKVGGVVAFPRVQHPGNQPNRFLIRARDAVIH